MVVVMLVALLAGGKKCQRESDGAENG